MVIANMLRTIFLLAVGFNSIQTSQALSSSFHGHYLACNHPQSSSASASLLTMRKQKASDKRTRRMQRGDVLATDLIEQSLQKTLTSTPMTAADWNSNTKKVTTTTRSLLNKPQVSGGRGRSRKRSTLYNSLSSYHSRFLRLLTAEYLAEEQEVVTRIKSSVDNPLHLENSGYALYDMFPERRGNLFSDEVYRLVKAKDATQVYYKPSEDCGDTRQGQNQMSSLPPDHKFSNNDVIMLTLQHRGSGDFFDPLQLPTSSEATSVEARVISTGPTYVDIAMPGGSFEATFGPAPNDKNNGGNPKMRLRMDRFFSNVPYTRMVEALTQLTAIPERTKQASQTGIRREAAGGGSKTLTSKAKLKINVKQNPYDNICMDDIFRELIISTYAFTDPESVLFHDETACDLRDLAIKVSKPPMPSSVKLANQALAYIQEQGLAGQASSTFPALNGPQLTAVGAALTRKFTAITGPPGTGKTTVASAIAFGFTHQCRSISPHAKVLATAFSNVGADNLAEGFLKLGLKVVRVGKASAVSQPLWDFTLDAAINKDPHAQKAMDVAARATAQLTKLQRQQRGSKGGGSNNSNHILSERTAREMATQAVKSSIRARNVAATKALREADVIVSTSTGASDSQLLAACGLYTDVDELAKEDKRLPGKAKIGLGSAARSAQAISDGGMDRGNAPDGLPPLSLPFVIVDEACQSVEPATLIPITASNSCRSVVVLGDPCQLPATVRHDPDSILSVSLMERLAATLPQPLVTAQPDKTEKDSQYLNALPIKQARSLRHSLEQGKRTDQTSYRKSFPGSLLLSVQYRMHPSIAAFPSALFYDGLLSTPWELGPTRAFPRYLEAKLNSPDSNTNVRMINVGGRCHERRGDQNKLTDPLLMITDSTGESTSFCNYAEAMQVVDLVHEILESIESTDTLAPKSIGVVTPYTGQVQLIKRMLNEDEDIQGLISNKGTTLEVKSVDGYQGRERDIIIFSAVRSNRRGNVGFLSDWRRLNVALTRARNALVVVGDLETLASGDKNWAAFGKWCEGVQCIFDVFPNRSPSKKVTQ